jgi:hypothetical protein
MIVFDLRCGRAHVFEAWFASSADYEVQNARGQIACPGCGDLRICKAVMAPAIAAKSNRGTLSRSDADETQACDPPTVDFAPLLAAQRRMEATADYVGDQFAARARELHERGDTGTGIYGEATRAEAAALVADGIPVLPLPFCPLVRSDA